MVTENGRKRRGGLRVRILELISATMVNKSSEVCACACACVTRNKKEISLIANTLSYSR